MEAAQTFLKTTKPGKPKQNPDADLVTTGVLKTLLADLQTNILADVTALRGELQGLTSRMAVLEGTTQEYQRTIATMQNDIRDLSHKNRLLERRLDAQEDTRRSSSSSTFLLLFPSDRNVVVVVLRFPITCEFKKSSSFEVSAGGYSVESLLAPPPSVNSQRTSLRKFSNSSATTEQTAEPPPDTNAVNDVNRKTANTVVLDLLTSLMEPADLIINGQTVAERDTLNGMMVEHLRNYKEDVRNAQIEIFGQEMELNELDNIKEPKKTDLANKLSLEIKRRAEARYIASRKAREKKITETVTYTNTM
ncbi:uncharacterized protein LOC134589063 [Pelobates fuscus]|uniref:uncharacterized protein LOC134589063 n=1 Tax=Pelobates fuscus TaxID=191477 RepID=UPI002FE4F32C